MGDEVSWAAGRGRGGGVNEARTGSMHSVFNSLASSVIDIF